MASRSGPGIAMGTLAILLAGCSSGAIGPASPIPQPLPGPLVPPPPPTPTPTPTPTPPSGGFDTPEFRRSNAVTSSNAIAAYQAGATGAGVTVAVIDSGIDPTSAEFAGRISDLSRDTAGSRGLGDDDGHGSSVSGILLAARNDSKIHGIAFESTLLAIRADRPGSCATECVYPSAAIAEGLNVAAGAGARVVNLSLGGVRVSDGESAGLLRATVAGAVVVISAGNDGDEQVDVFASSGTASAVPGTLIIAGAVDANGRIAEFSNRAGTFANNYLVALGTEVLSFNQNGEPFLYSGTSESAPIISGAAALLADAFPNLSNVQIVDILLRTADDRGAPGTDAIYGRGELNIGRAFSPIGALSVANVAAPLTSVGGSLGAPVGDAGATGMALSRVVARDDYDRPYQVNVAASLRGAAPGRLAAALGGSDVRAASGQVGRVGLSFATRGGTPVARDTGWRGAVLAEGDQAVTRAQALVSGRATVAIDGDRTAALGFGMPLDRLVDGATGQDWGGDRLVAGFDPVGREIGGAALAQRIGGFTATLAMGETVIGGDRERIDPARATRALLRLDRDLGALHLGISGEMLVERGALFGSRLAMPFGVRGGTTMTAGLRAMLPIGGWSLAGEARVGTTRADLTGSGIVQRMSGLTGTAASLTLARGGVFGGDDRISLTLAQPLRASGRAALALGGETAEWTGFGPSGREVAAELGYGRAIGRGWIGLGLFWREQPGHIADAAPDAGGAVRFRMGY